MENTGCYSIFLVKPQKLKLLEIKIENRFFCFIEKKWNFAFRKVRISKKSKWDIKIREKSSLLEYAKIPYF